MTADYRSTVRCPHGDLTCPCQDTGPAACHYEGGDAFICPNPVLGIRGLSNPHCHMEGCDWHVTGRSPDMPVDGVCGLIVKIGLPPVEVIEGVGYYSMAQASPRQPGWACGFLRTPLNVSVGCSHKGSSEGESHG
jgi:hypothetical protein